MDIYSEILSALASEERVMLATIVSTSGSTPASALSKMLVKNNGIVSVGTIGGGCMEGDVLLHARRLFETNKAEILKFHLNEDDIEHGLICGGSLDVLLEPISKKDVSLFQEIKMQRDEGNDCVLATFLLNDGSVIFKKVVQNREWSNGVSNERSGEVLEKWSFEFLYSISPTLHYSILCFVQLS